MTFRNDPGGRRLPVKLDATSNGEYAPIPLEPVHREAKHIANPGGLSEPCVDLPSRSF